MSERVKTELAQLRKHIAANARKLKRIGHQVADLRADTARGKPTAKHKSKDSAPAQW